MITVYCQGCIAIRNISGFGQFARLGYGQSKDKWALDINNRYFQAPTFYSGDAKQPDDGIVLYEYTINFELTRILENGWSNFHLLDPGVKMNYRQSFLDVDNHVDNFCDFMKIVNLYFRSWICINKPFVNLQSDSIKHQKLK